MSNGTIDFEKVRISDAEYVERLERVQQWQVTMERDSLLREVFLAINSPQGAT